MLCFKKVVEIDRASATHLFSFTCQVLTGTQVLWICHHGSAGQAHQQPETPLPYTDLGEAINLTISNGSFYRSFPTDNFFSFIPFFALFPSPHTASALNVKSCADIFIGGAGGVPIYGLSSHSQYTLNHGQNKRVLILPQG